MKKRQLGTGVMKIAKKRIFCYSNSIQFRT